MSNISLPYCLLNNRDMFSLFHARASHFRFFRNLFRALLPIFAFAGAAHAQLTCDSTITASPVVIRAEGNAEQLADVTLTCAPIAQSAIVDLQVYVAPAVPITSKVLNSTTGETEAVATAGGSQIRGKVTGSTLAFLGLNVPANTSAITISNIRVQATVVQSSVSEQIFVQGPNATPVVTQPATVAYIAASLRPTTSGATTYSICSNVTPSSGPAFALGFTEAFATAFKTRGDSSNTQPGSEFAANTETGLYQAISSVNNQAASGTRIRAVFSNVPAGVSVYVPTTLYGIGQSGVTPTLALVTSESGPFSAAPAAGGSGLPANPSLSAVALESGSGEAVYEVVSQDGFSLESYTVPVYLNADGSALAAAPPITVTVNLAPVGSADIPDFTTLNSLVYTATASNNCQLSINTQSLPAATQNSPYSQPLTAGSGNGALTWTVTDGSLPAGLSLNPATGVIEGVPSATGSFPFTVKVADPATDAIQSYSLVVNPAHSGLPTTCVDPGATVALLRAEGRSEQLGDFTFTCDGGGTIADVEVTLPSTLTITSKILADATGETEATAITSAGSARGVVNGSRVVFRGLLIPSGPSTVTITNIRIDATTASGVNGDSISEQVSLSGSFLNPLFTPAIPAGYILPGLAGVSGKSVNFPACSNLAFGSGPVFSVKIGENFPSVFKAQGGTGNSTLGSPLTLNTETGLFESIGGVSNQASSGTRVRVIFTHVPAGAALYVPVTVTGSATGGLTTPLLQLTASETGAFTAVTAISGTNPGLAQVPVTDGTGEVIYEVTAQNPLSIDSFDVPVYLAGTASALTGAPNPITATVSLAPVGSSGNPAFAAGALTFTATASSTCTFTVRSSTLPVAFQGAAYSQQLLAGPGAGAITWSVPDGSLPAGISLDPATGLLSGTPTESGAFTFTVQAQDQGSASDSRQLTLQVNPAVILSAKASEACFPTANAVFVRSDSVNDLASPLHLVCAGGGATVNLQTALNRNITSKLLADGETEAIAVTTAGTVRGVVSGSSVTFYGVQIPAGSAQVTIENIRVDASTDPSGSVPSGVSETPMLFYADGSQIMQASPVAFSLNALSSPTAAVSTGFSLSTPVLPSNGPASTLKFSEQFVGALKVAAAESGVPAGSNAADNGTRVAVIFRNVPAGVNLYAPVTVTGTGGTVLTWTAAETGPFSAVSPLPPSDANALPPSPGLAPVNVTSGLGTIIYETTAAGGPGVTNEFSVPVYLGTASGVSSLSAPIPASVRLAPIDAPGNIPDFVDRNYTPVIVAGFTSMALPTGVTGSPYGPFTIPVSGGTAPYKFSNGSLPAGLAISSDGVVSGIPTTATAGVLNAPVVILDANQVGFTAVVSIRILPGLTVTTSTLPSVPLNAGYSQTIAVQGGTPSYTFAVTSGSLPPGLSLNPSSGAITGTATTHGAYPFTITVTDSGTVGTTGLSAQVISHQYQISTGLTITSTGPLVPAFLNFPYSTPFTASNGTGPFTWSLESGALPAGLNLDPATGVLSGTPTAAGHYTFDIKVTDSSGPTPQSWDLPNTLAVSQYVVSTIAGAPLATPQPSVSASLGNTGRPVVDAAGNIYFAALSSIFKVDADEKLTRIAGTGRRGYSGDGGPATDAQISGMNIAVDNNGNIYIAEGRLRKVSPSGTITTIAGWPGDSVSDISAVATDAEGNVYFSSGLTILKQTPTGGRANYFTASADSIPLITDMVADAAGNVYLTGHSNIYKITPAGTQILITGTGTDGFGGDGGPANAATAWSPSLPVFDAGGNIYFFDQGNGRIRKISTSGTITTVFSLQSNTAGLARDGSGNFYLNDARGIKKISPIGGVSSLAGNTWLNSSGDGGSPLVAQTNVARVASDTAGRVYFSDPDNAAIREIHNGQIFTTVDTASNAGAPIQPVGIVTSGDGSVAWADSLRNQIRVMVLPWPALPTAGNGTPGYSGDGGSSSEAQLRAPEDVAEDTANNFYIADTGNNVIRKVDSNGIISTLAGSGVAGFSGDGGQATSAKLSNPTGVAISGNRLFIADTGNNRVRAVELSTGIIQTLTGDGVSCSTDGTAAHACLDSPGALAVDLQGNLYVVDASGLWRISPDGLYIGSVIPADTQVDGENSPSVSTFFKPRGVAVTDWRSIYVTDGSSIRLLTPTTAPPLSISTTILPSSAVGAAGYSATLTATGGTGAHTWSALPQALPPGLSLDSATGAVTGTPTQAGIFNFTVTVTDSGAMETTGVPAQELSQNFYISVLAPPSITTLSPNSQIAGAGTFTLTVNGSGFAPGAVIQWNGTALTTTFVSSTQLTASVPGGDISAAGATSITVENADGSASAASTFTISAASSGGGGGGGTTPPPANPLTLAPDTLTFNVAAGATPSTQTVTVAYQTFTAGIPSFSANSNTNQGTGWLSVSPSSGIMTPQPANGLRFAYQATLMVTVDPAKIPAGASYTGTVNILSAGALISLPVTVNVTLQPAKYTTSPSALSFTWQIGAESPAPATLTVLSTPAGRNFTANAIANSDGNWLHVSSSSGTTPAPLTVSIAPSGLAAGSYSGEIAISASGSLSRAAGVPVTLTVIAAQPPKISLSSGTTVFALEQGAPATTGQIFVSNSGGGTLQFSATATSTPGGWFTLSSNGGAAKPGAPSTLGFAVNPAGLSPGAYAGRITVTDTDSGAEATTDITLAVRRSAQSISLSQSGLTFAAVQNGPAPPTQSFTVKGSGAVNWSASSGLIGTAASNWLRIAPPSGSSDGAVAVSADPSGLAPGQYYGSVDVSAPGAVNSPQTVSVLLTVASNADPSPAPFFSTGALVFTARVADPAPAPRQISIFNPASSSDTFTASTSTADGASWLSVDASSGTLASGANGLHAIVSLTGLAAGVHTGTIVFAFGGGATASMQVVLIVTALPSSAVGGLQAHTVFSSACPGGNASYLVPVFDAPALNQTLQAGQAAPLRVYLFDDCGNTVSSTSGATVQVLFSNADSSVALNDTGNGVWEGTWIPAHASSQVTLTPVAVRGGLPSLPASITVTLLAANSTSAGVPDGVVNAASQAAAVPQVVTPGSFITIYGTNLAGNGPGSASSIPLPITLNSTQATLGGQPMPLLYAGPTQINAIVPQSLNPNTSYPLVVQNGATRSVPVPLTIVSPQPAIYTANLSGSGQGVVAIAGTSLLAAPASSTGRPAVRGTDYLVIYCTGLGPLTGSKGGAPPADGAAAPTDEVFQATDQVSVTVGGITANAAFAGLTPTLAGLYQINVQVPAAATAGDAVPLTVTVTDPSTGVASTSNVVTVALQ